MKEDLLVTIPNFHEAGQVMEDMFKFWNKSKNMTITAQTKWCSTIKSIYKKLQEVRTDPIFKRGIYELINSIHFMIVTNPTAVLNHYPCLASLGSTTKKLMRFTKWNKHLYETIIKVISNRVNLA